MLEFIVEEDCKKREDMLFILKQIEETIRDLVSLQHLDSLKYFVVSDSDMGNYVASVDKYAKLLNIKTALTNNESYCSGAKTLDGYNNDGQYTQAIIVKSPLIIAMYYDLLIQNNVSPESLPDLQNLKGVGLATIIHEIGHAINNVNIYNLKHHVNDKTSYNLNYELDEYIENIAYNLWEEYYAESFPYRILGTLEITEDINEEQLRECIKSYSKEKKIK